MKVQQAAEVKRATEFPKVSRGVVGMNHDTCSAACEPEVPQGRSPDTSAEDKAVDWPPSFDSATLSRAPKLVSDAYGSCGSTWASALIIDLQSQRTALRQSLEEAFDTIELKIQRKLHHQRHPTAPQNDFQSAPSRSTGQATCMDLASELDECSPHAAAPALPHTPHPWPLGRQMMCAGETFVFDKKQETEAVAGVSEPSTYDMVATSFPECGSHTTTKSVPRGCCKAFFAKLRTITDHRYFELSIAALILIQICALAIEVQYRSLEVCFVLGYPTCKRPAKEEWPAGEAAFQMLDTMFGVLIIFEVSLKLLSHHVHFFCSGWNCFDVFIALGFLLEALSPTVHGLRLIRLGRFAKFMRFFRLVKTILMFDVLQLLIGSLRASAMLLFWVAIVLAIIMVCAALLANILMTAFIEDDNLDFQTRLEAYIVFGSFSRSFMTMYQIAFFLDNAAPGLCFELNEWLVIPLILYQGVVSFAIIKVIEAGFLNETLKVVATNDDLKRTRQAIREEKVRAFAVEAAKSGDDRWAYRLPGPHEDPDAERTCRDVGRHAKVVLRS
eukprot:TRINITY_DN27509_c0_g2_i1.p1 TRINITY_DN27509_c0_g2~~TRINITY_DN27509_c0_g2_i1.p1  ORF type:complete len:556 (+),score=59.23 TRINITY_DN27509_c0_g2_i1:42-1709(+)